MLFVGSGSFWCGREFLAQFAQDSRVTEVTIGNSFIEGRVEYNIPQHYPSYALVVNERVEEVFDILEALPKRARKAWRRCIVRSLRRECVGEVYLPNLDFDFDLHDSPSYLRGYVVDQGGRRYIQ